MWTVFLNVCSSVGRRVNLPELHLLRKAASASPSFYQLSLPPQLGVGLCAHLPSAWRDLVWFEQEQVFCVLSRSLWVYIVSVCCPENSVSVHVSTTSGSHALPATSPKINPQPWKKCVWYKCLIEGQVTHKQLISEPWPVVELCIIAVFCW